MQVRTMTATTGFLLPNDSQAASPASNETQQSPPEYNPNCDLFNFILWGIVGGVLCLFGCIGNSLSFTAFQKDRRTPATTLLQSLASSDFVLLMAVFVTDALPYACGYTAHCPNIWITWPYVRYIWIMTPISHMCSIWFVVLIACNRYWAVCRPHQMSRMWSIQRTIKYIIFVLIFVLGFNIPRFFEYIVVEEVKPNTTETFLKEQRTEFGLNYNYKVIYKVYLVNVLLILTPIMTLMILTVCITKAIHSRQKKLEKKSTNRTGSGQDITLILVLVVVVAIVCQTPLCLFHFVRYSHRYGCGDFVFYLDNVSKLLVTINSCVNFIIYCLFSVRFRRLLWVILFCQGNVGTQIEPYTSTRREYSMTKLR